MWLRGRCACVCVHLQRKQFRVIVFNMVSIWSTVHYALRINIFKCKSNKFSAIKRILWIKIVGVAFVCWWLSFHLKCTYHATRSICRFCPNRQRICFSRLNFLWETIATVLWKVSGNAIDAFRSEGRYYPVNVVLATNKIESKRCDVSRLFFPRCFKYSIEDFLIKKIHWNLLFFPHFWPFSYFFHFAI